MSWLELIVFNPGFLIMVIGAMGVLNRRQIAARGGAMFGGLPGGGANPTPSRQVAVFGYVLIVPGFFLFVLLLMTE